LLGDGSWALTAEDVAAIDAMGGGEHSKRFCWDPTGIQ